MNRSRSSPSLVPMFVQERPAVSGATRHSIIRSARYNSEVGILVLIAFAVFLRYALVSIGVCLPLIVLVAILFV
jgi:hypothetical protein